MDSWLDLAGYDPCATLTRPRRLSPTERRRKLEALMDEADRGLRECAEAGRASLLGGLRFRESGGRVIVQALHDRPEDLAVALEDAGFRARCRGMFVLAVRPLPRRGVRPPASSKPPARVRRTRGRNAGPDSGAPRLDDGPPSA